MSEFTNEDEMELRPLACESEEESEGEVDEEKFVEVVAEQLHETLERVSDRVDLFDDLCQTLRVQFPAKTEEQIEEIAVSQLKIRELAEQNTNLNQKEK